MGPNNPRRKQPAIGTPGPVKKTDREGTPEPVKKSMANSRQNLRKASGTRRRELEFTVVDEVHSFQEILCTQERCARRVESLPWRKDVTSRATFLSDVDEETMSATVKLAKEIDEPDIGQTSAECQFRGLPGPLFLTCFSPSFLFSSFSHFFISLCCPFLSLFFLSFFLLFFHVFFSFLFLFSFFPFFRFICCFSCFSYCSFCVPLFSLLVVR